MKTERLLELESRHSSGATGRRPVVIVRGEGARLWDSEGREYIDCAAGHGWANPGHSHPVVTRAIQEQAARLIMHTESSGSDQRALWFAELLEVLRDAFGESGRGPFSRIHPCNSGAEAVEGALKLARQLTGRPGVVAAKGGFHGRTMGALSATWNPKYRKGFEPFVPEFEHVTFNDVAAAEAAVGERTAAIIVEIVQGEGGVRPGAPDYFRALRRICDERGALLVVDEIQTGLGRTGKWFACQHIAGSADGAGGLQPDVLVLGKALGGGVPMGAFVWREELGKFASGTHGGTFGGNPLACAAARAVLRTLREEALPERAADLGAKLIAELREIDAPVVREVRGLGLMVGVELRTKVASVLRALMERGVWALPAGPTVLRLLPPLVIAEQDMRSAVQAVREVLSSVRSN